jgi:hypothetical protein
MKKLFLYGMAGSAAMLLAACGNPKLMLEKTSDISVYIEPPRSNRHYYGRALAASELGDSVETTIVVEFKPSFFEPSAVLEMLPVLVWYDGSKELPLQATYIQVKGNHYTGYQSYILGESYLGGDRYRGYYYGQKIKFKCTDDMLFTDELLEYHYSYDFSGHVSSVHVKEKGYTNEKPKVYLEIRPTLIIKDQRIPFPNNIKVADGVSNSNILRKQMKKEYGRKKEEMNRIIDEERDERRKAAYEKKKAEVEALKAQLIPKYGIETGTKLAEGQIWLGMTREMMMDVGWRYYQIGMWREVQEGIEEWSGIWTRDGYGFLHVMFFGDKLSKIYPNF